MTEKIQLPLSVPDICRLIPHRYPFLMVDRIIEFVDLERIVGEKYLSANEPFFQGHFPGRPILPGVLMLESLAQVGVVFARLMTNGLKEGRMLLFTGVDEARFRRQVVPGEVMRIEMNSFRQKFGHWKMEGAAYVGNQVAMQAIIRAAEAEA